MFELAVVVAVTGVLLAVFWPTKKKAFPLPETLLGLGYDFDAAADPDGRPFRVVLDEVTDIRFELMAPGPVLIRKVPPDLSGLASRQPWHIESADDLAWLIQDLEDFLEPMGARVASWDKGLLRLVWEERASPERLEFFLETGRHLRDALEERRLARLDLPLRRDGNTLSGTIDEAELQVFLKPDGACIVCTMNADFSARTRQPEDESRTGNPIIDRLMAVEDLPDLDDATLERLLELVHGLGAELTKGCLEVDVPRDTGLRDVVDKTVALHAALA